LFFPEAVDDVAIALLTIFCYSSSKEKLSEIYEKNAARLRRGTYGSDRRRRRRVICVVSLRFRFSLFFNLSFSSFSSKSVDCCLGFHYKRNVKKYTEFYL